MADPETKEPATKDSSDDQEPNLHPPAPESNQTSPATSNSTPLSSGSSNSANWNLLHGQRKVAIGESESDSSGDKAEVRDEDVLDKGYAWVIVLGGFLSQVLIGGLMRCDGIFYLQFRDRLHQNKQLTAWPSAISFTLQCFIAPVATAFCNRFSVRTAVHLGTFLLTSGLVITAFVPNIYCLFLSYSVLQGIGRGLVMAPGIFIVNMYFKKRLGIALGFASSGTGIGTLGLPPLITWLFNTLGYQTGFLIIAGISTAGWGIAMLFRPLSMHKDIVRERRLKEKLLRGKSKFDSTYRRKGFYSWYGSIETTQPNQNTSSSGYSSKTDHGNDLTQSTSSESTSQEGQNTPDDLHNVIDIRRRKKKKNCCCACVETVFPVEGEKRGRKKRRLLHWSLFKDFPFLVLCVSMAFFNLAQKTVFTFLPAIAEQKGISAYSVMLSVAGAGGTVGRVAAGFFMDRPRIKPHKCAVYSLILFFAAGAALMVPFSDSLLMLCVPCTLYGFMVGASVSQKSNVLAALLGKETVNSAFGILYSFQGLGTLAGPPLSGALGDQFDDYDFAFYLSGGSMFSAGALVALSVMLFGIRTRQREGAGGHEYESLPTNEESSDSTAVPVEESSSESDQNGSSGSETQMSGNHNSSLR